MGLFAPQNVYDFVDIKMKEIDPDGVNGAYTLVSSFPKKEFRDKKQTLLVTSDPTSIFRFLKFIFFSLTHRKQNS